MIQCREFPPHFKERFEFLNSQSEKNIYLVPDIKSKLTFQEKLLEKKNVLEESQIQRAQDFYSSLFLFNFPEWNLISFSHLEFLFKTWSFNKDPLSISSHLQSFLPFLTHPEGTTIFQQWIQENDSRKKYKKSFLVTQNFWSHLKQLKLMEKSCIKYALTNQELETWDFSLTVDLGFSIEPIEIEIFQNISKQRAVTFLIPPKLHSPLFENSHKVYSYLNFQVKKEPSRKIHSKNVYRFQNIVDEVQFVTHQIRKNIEDGIQASEMTVIAPDIETYWPCLKTYLKREGIPFSKETSVSYLSFPQIQKWLSSIRLFFGKIDCFNLEDTYFYQKNYSLPPYRLQSFCKNCDRPSDIEKFKNLEKNFKFPIYSKQKITVEEFIKNIFNLWQPCSLEIDMNNLLSEVFNPLSMKVNSPVDFLIEMLESFISQKNYLQKNSEKKGVQCISLNALTSLHAQNIYLIGLNHPSCQKVYPHIINENDIQKIVTDLGFYGPQLDSNQYEYEIQNLLNHFQGSITLSYAQTQLNQEITQPSRIWYMEYQGKTLSEKPQTVLNSIQKLDSLEKILDHSFHAPSLDEVQQNLSNVFKNVESFCLEDTSLSANKIKTYMKCPFIFLAEEVFKFKHEPSKDVDMEALKKGFLLHELLETIVKNKLQTSLQVQEWIQDHSHKIKSYVMDEEALKFYEQELLNKATSFLEKEKLNLEKNPRLKTLATEFEFEQYWNLEKERLDTQGDILIKGRIDRVDECNDQILVIDYKSSSLNTFIFSHWEKKLDVQMPLYIQALENHFQNEVSGAVYLNLKNFSYKGFILKTSDWKKLLPLKSQSLSEKEKIETELQKINKNIQKIIKKIQEGHFPPEPHEPKNCLKCQWNQICRAPHL